MKRMNLQFFGDVDGTVPVVDIATGVEEPTTIAESTETEGNGNEVVVTDGTAGLDTDAGATEVSESESTEVEKARDYDKDAIYAALRRKAEADVKAEAKKEQDKIDAEYARRFGNYKNPLTGEPIRTQADYLAALDAQEQARLEKQMKDSGIDANVLQQFIDNNPAVRQAREYMARQQEADAMRQIEADVAELGTIDPSIKTFDNVPREVVELATNKHISLTDAYKVLNYGKVTKQNAEAMRQSAVNQIKGKQHLAPMNGVATNNAEVEIPVADRAIWESIFPNMSYAERRTLYNKQLNR